MPGHKLTALAAQRLAGGRTLEQLAFASGTSVHFLARAEAGDELDVAETARIAGVLGVTLTTLGKIDAR